MPVTVKTDEEIALMREAGKILAVTHRELEKALKPGMSTWELDRLAEEIIRSHGAVPSFLNYEGFPNTLCVSINEEVVHGIPRQDRFICEGDIVSIDAGVLYRGYHSDAARTHAVGEISPEKKKLIDVTREAFYAGIKMAKAGNHLHDISEAIGAYAERFGYGVVRELTGHGIGTHLHEDPVIPNYKVIGKGIRLKAGMTLAVEPMLNMGTCRVEWVDDWTVISADHSPSAHYENTILITDGEPEILSA